MDLTNILNNKDGAAAAVPPLTLSSEMHKHPYLASSRDHPHSPAASDFVSDREGSPRSSTSPSASGGSPSAYPLTRPLASSDTGGTFSGTTGPVNTVARGPGRPSSGDPFSKAFPCSVCNKGFARRSDLARHGTLRPLVLLPNEASANVFFRANTYRSQATCLRPPRLR